MLGLAGPSAYMGNEGGEVLAGLVAPVLDHRMTFFYFIFLHIHYSYLLRYERKNRLHRLVVEMID